MEFFRILWDGVCWFLVEGCLELGLSGYRGVVDCNGFGYLSLCKDSV